jgi:hypothetical protein
MGTAKRATVYLDPDLHRALRVKAAVAEKSVSDAKEPSVDLEKVLKDLRRRGKL